MKCATRARPKADRIPIVCSSVSRQAHDLLCCDLAGSDRVMAVREVDEPTTIRSPSTAG